MGRMGKAHRWTKDMGKLECGLSGEWRLTKHKIGRESEGWAVRDCECSANVYMYLKH